jgi:hypothetical protein
MTTYTVTVHYINTRGGVTKVLKRNQSQEELKALYDRYATDPDLVIFIFTPEN